MAGTSEYGNELSVSIKCGESHCLLEAKNIYNIS